MRLILALTLICLGGCRFLRPRPDDEARGERDVKQTAARAEAQPDPDEIDGPHTVLLLVVDTLRADRMSLCGYERPTTPWLKRYVEQHEGRVAWTCDAAAPGTWTLPSHASYFTGLWPTEHHLMLKAVPLRDDVTTLAETFKERGFQTALVSANPTLSPSANITQGFDVVVRGRSLIDLREREFPKRLRQVLRDLDPERPLFLVANLIDVHDPYPAIPAGVSWLPEQDEIPLLVDTKKPELMAVRYMRGQIPADQADRWLARVRDGYDYGVSLADQNVGAVLRTLKDEGFADAGLRFVITSDHGEHQGEHGMVRHNGIPYQPVSRVPLLFRDDTLAQQPVLTGPVSAIVTYNLLLDGRLPDPMPLPVAVSMDDAHDEPWREPGVAVWTPDHRKLVWRAGESVAFDLKADPLEQNPLPIGAEPLAAELERAVQQMQATEVKVRGENRSKDMAKELAELGYVE